MATPTPYSLPPLNSNVPVYDMQKRLLGYATWPQPWGNWLSQTWQIVSDQQNYGATAGRPTTNLYVGKAYFDTTLGTYGKPIWIGKDGATWILADGTTA